MIINGLNFHGIGQPERTVETSEKPYWLDQAIFEEILDRVAAAEHPRAYCISFDDSNASDYSIALPALKDRGLTAKFFVLTGRLESTGSLNAEQIRTLLKEGMTVGSHGINHVPWSRIKPSELISEITESRRRLEDICECPVDEAGIPFGLYNSRVLRALKSAGYKAAFTSDKGLMNTNNFLRPRTSFRSDMTIQNIQEILDGKMSMSAQLRRSAGLIRKQFLPLF